MIITKTNVQNCFKGAIDNNANIVGVRFNDGSMATFPKLSFEWGEKFLENYIELNSKPEISGITYGEDIDDVEEQL